MFFDTLFHAVIDALFHAIIDIGKAVEGLYKTLVGLFLILPLLNPPFDLAAFRLMSHQILDMHACMTGVIPKLYLAKCSKIGISKGFCMYQC